MASIQRSGAKWRYGQASQAEYADLSKLSGGVTDADIFASVASVKAEGTVVWMAIANASGVPPIPVLLYNGGSIYDGSQVYSGIRH